MKKHVCLFLFFLYCISSGWAQQARTDTLTPRLDEVYGVDRIKLLLKLSDQNKYNNTRIAIDYGLQALELSKKLDNDSLTAYAFGKTATFYRFIDSGAKAVKNYHAALQIYKELDDKLNIGRTQFNLGAFYYHRNNYVNALDYFYQALAMFKEVKYNSGLADLLLRIGMVYEKRKESGKALEYYGNALNKSVSSGSYSTATMVCVQMAGAYGSLEDDENTLEFLNRALAFADSLPGMQGKHAIASILLNISKVYNDKEFFDQALVYINQALEVAKKMNNTVLMANSYRNMAKVYAAKGEYEKSNGFIYQVIESGVAVVVADSHIFLAKNYNALKQYDKAIAQANLALGYGESLNKLGVEKEALQQLIASNSEKGDYKASYLLQQKLTSVNDSLFDKEKTEQIAAMTARYQVEEAEQEAALLQKEKEKNELLLNILVVGIGLLLIIAALVFSRQRAVLRAREIALENTVLHEKEMEQDIETQNRQLTAYTLSLVQKNGALKEVQEKVNQVRKQSDDGSEKEFKRLNHLLEQQLDHENDWKEFKLYFENVHKGFLNSLKQKHPNLSSKDLRFCALLRLNLNIKEMADLLGISPDSVKMARYRLRQKLNLNTKDNLPGYLQSIDADSPTESK